jgi:hypothetical protein
MRKHRKHRARRLAPTLGPVVAVAVVLAATGHAHGSTAPSERSPGPRLTTPANTLATALECPQGVGADRDPVLLVPGGGGEPSLIFAAGLEPVLRAEGYPVCTVTLPDAAFGDLQVQAEYVVAAIRTMASESARPVSVIGVSQGGPVARWALKWWRDVRLLVGDVIGLAPSNHGFALAPALCGGPCPPATRQQIAGSRFLTALNRGDETPGAGRVAYSVIFSETDANVPPPFPDLRGESEDTNTAVQEICPGRQVDHGHIQYDAFAIALVLDALGHEGPARASRVASAACETRYPEGVDPVAVDLEIASALRHFFANFTVAGLTEVEPQLKSYVPGWRRG